MVVSPGEDNPRRNDGARCQLFQADDIVETCRELAARGVEFTEERSRQPWGWSAVFKDDEGHLFHLGQRWGRPLKRGRQVENENHSLLG
ncbi:VOC family protein [Nonomuraea aridisoli]|uniref:VOC family protein n=1 Tax=Nonomuraea aridisoli TaxID=2070368 RepID=UPI0015E8E160